jgi:hypothetical protein
VPTPILKVQPPPVASKAVKSARASAIFTAKLTAKSDSVIPPNRLFATGKSQPGRAGTLELLQSASASAAGTVPQFPTVQPTPTAGKAFNASKRIRFTAAAR